MFNFNKMFNSYLDDNDDLYSSLYEDEAGIINPDGDNSFIESSVRIGFGWSDYFSSSSTTGSSTTESSSSGNCSSYTYSSTYGSVTTQACTSETSASSYCNDSSFSFTWSSAFSGRSCTWSYGSCKLTTVTIDGNSYYVPKFTFSFSCTNGDTSDDTADNTDGNDWSFPSGDSSDWCSIYTWMPYCNKS